MTTEFVLLVDASPAELERLQQVCAPTPIRAAQLSEVAGLVATEVPLAVLFELKRHPEPIRAWVTPQLDSMVFPVVLMVAPGDEKALTAWVQSGARHWVHRDHPEELPLVLDLMSMEAAEREVRQSAQRRVQESTAALVRLARSPRVTGPDSDASIREVTRLAVKGLAATRSGVWLLDDAREHLKLVDRYDRRDESHQNSEPPLPPHPEYLKVMRAHRIIAVSDSQTDRRTREFGEGYFAPADIRSNIDVGLRLRGEVVGVLSVEQIGRRREWTAEDEVFAGVLGDVVSLALESAERFRAETALRQSERRLSDIFKFTNDSIVLYRVALDGSVFCEDINPAGEAATGVLRDEAIGRKPQDVLPALNETVVKDQFQKCITTRMSTALESELTLPDGVRTVSTALVPLLDESGNVERIAAVSRDMTPVRAAEQMQRKLELQLAELQKHEALSRLATNLAVDMSNTLDLISTQLSQLSESPVIPADAVQAIRTATRRGRQLTKDTLDYARRRVPDKNRVNLAELVTGVVTTLQKSAAPQLVLKGAAEAVWVMGEAAQLQRSFSALVLHAIRSAKEASNVDMTLSTVQVTAGMAAARPPLVERRYVKLKVNFQGKVLSSEEQRRLFEPFFVTSNDPESSGLGLAVAQTLVAAHDGTVFVESSEFTGTSFHIFVPVAPEVSVAPVYRLMLVDDHAGMARVSARLLETMGYRTSVFDNPHDALAEFTRAPHAFDAVLTDLSMPQMSGEQFTHAVHQVRPGMPIIISSGRAGDLDPATLESLGVKGVLVKPWRLDEALATLTRALKV